MCLLWSVWVSMSSLTTFRKERKKEKDNNQVVQVLFLRQAEHSASIISPNPDISWKMFSLWLLLNFLHRRPHLGQGNNGQVQLLSCPVINIICFPPYIFILWRKTETENTFKTVTVCSSQTE